MGSEMCIRDRDYLGLNANEWSVLQGLKEKKAAGEISRIVVLINYSSMIEGDFLNDPDIDAALWVGALGVGNEATGKLLTGEVSPSGRLPDTMWVDNAKNPVNANFGSWVYENAGEYGISTEKPKRRPIPKRTVDILPATLLFLPMLYTRKVCTWGTATRKPVTRTMSWAQQM